MCSEIIFIKNKKKDTRLECVQIRLSSMLEIRLGVILVLVEFCLLSTAIRTIDESNCLLNTTYDVTSYSPTVSWESNITIPMLYEKCLIRVRNFDFNQKYVYDASVQVDSYFHSFLIEIFVGHPNYNKKVKTFYAPGDKWNGHIPYDEIYIQFTGYDRITFRVSVTIKECMEHCYPLQAPSIMSTSIIDLPQKCNVNKCIDNYAISYHIRSQYLSKPCALNFTTNNNPRVCLTVSNTCCHNRYSCFVGTISVGISVYMRIDHVISRPWCLPWRLSGQYLTLTLETKDVAIDSPCVIRLVTNTTRSGECKGTDVTVSSVQKEKAENNTVLVIFLTTIGVLILFICTSIIIYLVVIKARKPSTEEDMYSVRYLPTPRDVPPPPYCTVHTISGISTPSFRSFIEQADSSSRSNPSSVIICERIFNDPPPPYSEH